MSRSNTASVRGLPLAAKLAGLLAGAGGLAAMLSFALLGQILMPVFVEIENRVVSDQVARAQFLLESYNSEIEEKVMDYAVWTATYNYLTTVDPAYEAEFTGTSTLVNLDVDLMSVRRFDGSELYTDVLGTSRKDLDPALSAAAMRALSDPVLFDQMVHSPSMSFYLPVDGAIYAIHATHILRSDSTGTPFGIQIMGARLREAGLSAALQVDASLDFKPGQKVRSIFADPARQSVSSIGKSEIATTLPLRDNQDQLLGTIEFSTPRSITFAGERAVLLATAVMAVSMLILVVTIFVGIQRMVVNRLKQLGGHIEAFNQDRRPVSEALRLAGDEVGELARQFDTLGTELEEAEEELRQQSYVQGKADSAVGLLHNIRNSLGPLQVKHERWLKEDTKPYRGQLRQALDELAQAPAGDRRQKLEQFVKQATQRLLVSGDERARELTDIKESIDHIVSILSEYDFDSSSDIRVEGVALGGMIEREVAAQNAKLPVPIALEIDSAIPKVLANRIVAQQIVGNLVANAIDAMLDAGSDPMRLWVSASSPDGETLQIAIRDNGSGAEAGVLERAFERGFSTRKGKSGGAGLHWSANAANALGGKLALASDGPGQGATALLTLPLAKPENIRAAA